MPLVVGGMQLPEVQVPVMKPQVRQGLGTWGWSVLPSCVPRAGPECPYLLFLQPTTLPQGTINMNQCTDVVDGEGRTGQKFSLCILTPEKEHFIRAETKEIISG